METSAPKVEASLEDAKPSPSPRVGFAQAQQGCSTFSRFCLEIWRRIRLEVVVELPLLKERWKAILFGVVMQYVHGIFTQLAHRMHQPQEQPLHDVGFDLTPELGPEQHWVSETIFGIAFAAFVLWSFSPFVCEQKRFYTAVIWSRLLMVLVVCQALRIVTFSVTQLPGPSFHCRAHEASARRPWPAHWTGHLVVDVGRQVSKSCGDLIFSSHTTFMLTGILAYNEYGAVDAIKACSWALGAVLSLLIIASRKHYTVDVVIAWYTVPLVFYAMHRRWTTKREFGSALDGDMMYDRELDLEQALAHEPFTMTSGKANMMMGGGMQPRPNTLKIGMRSTQEGRHAGEKGEKGGMRGLFPVEAASGGRGDRGDADAVAAASGMGGGGGRQLAGGQVAVVRASRSSTQDAEWAPQPQPTAAAVLQSDEGGRVVVHVGPQQEDKDRRAGGPQQQPAAQQKPWASATVG